MTKRNLPPATAWAERDVSDWNVKTTHQYLIDRNRELFGAEYIPFGRGPISQRWRTEQGQLKQAITTHGAHVVKAFIDRCLAKHRPSRDYPHINWGFAWAYMRDEMARAVADLQRADSRVVAEGERMSDEEIGEWL